MNTPTPLTDEAWSSAFNAEDFSASSVARSMRVFSQKIEIELAAANEACRVASEDALLMRDDLYKQLAALTAERDQLRADRTYNHECINRLAVATGTLGEKSEKVVDVVLSTIAQLHALQLVCGTTDADKFSTWVDRANARAERAEADLAALGQSFDDNCRGVVRIADELATERARLDWLESPAGMDWQWQAGITRATIDAKMQKGAK